MIRDADAAGEIATGAGQVLLSIRAIGGESEALKASGDAASHSYISEQLADRYPSDAILSEEGEDDSDRLVNRRVWIIDPLDGTREFSELPRLDWAVHIARVQGGELVAGAVAAGLHVSRLDGSAVRYNQPHPWLRDILICRSEFAQEVIRVCRAAA